MSKKRPSLRQSLIAFAVGIGLGLIGLGLYTFVGDDDGSATAELRAGPQVMSSAASHPNRRAKEDPDWTVGELRPNGLRIKPSGRNDASRVLDPTMFVDRAVRNAYAIARKIPEMLNKLYCWCGCENRGVHRSNLGCFEDQMAVNCDVCRGTAEIAYRMMQEGETDAGKIQAAVDLEWGPDWAKREQRNRR